jgi:ribosomal protein L37E
MSYTISPDGKAITCHRCGLTSHNLHDVRHRYCGRCNIYHDDVATQGPVRWRHKARGTTYSVMEYEARVQVASGEPIVEGDLVVVYRAESDGSVWVRRRSEFLDGRFEAEPA